MNMRPRSDATLLIRTDFADQPAWQALLATIRTPNEDGFQAYPQIHLPGPATPDPAEMPILVLDLIDQPPRRPSGSSPHSSGPSTTT